MQNIQDDKYWYLSGEAKRGAIASDVKTKLRDLQKETDKKFEDLQLELELESLFIAKVNETSRNMSIKPGTKVAYKKRKVELSKKTLAVGACVIYIAGGLTMPRFVEMAQNISTAVERNIVVAEEVQEFSVEHVVPNTHYSFAADPETKEKVTVHWHDNVDIVMNAKQKHEDPVVAFYMIYASLDEHCRKEDIGSILNIFNRLYGTNYADVKDFMQKNNFTSAKEWKSYVGNALMEKEETLDGSSNFGRQ